MVLVSAHFLSYWTVVIRGPQDLQEIEGSGAVIATAPLALIFPRRWLDVHGRRIAEIWEAACRAVMGIVIFRPGITQVSALFSVFSLTLTS